MITIKILFRDGHAARAISEIASYELTDSAFKYTDRYGGVTYIPLDVIFEIVIDPRPKGF